jgi:hypothetical protein
MGSLFRPSLSQESQSKNTMNLWGCGGGSLYNTAFHMLVIASFAGHFTPAASHLIQLDDHNTIKVNKQQKNCWPGIFWYAKILRQNVV